MLTIHRYQFAPASLALPMFWRVHLLGSCHSVPQLHSWWQPLWHSPLCWAKILYALKSTVWDIRGFVKYFLAYGWSLLLIWRQIFPATSLLLLTPALPALSCPSSLAGEDAGGHRLFVCTKTKLCWVIRTRHAWLSAYQSEERRKKKKEKKRAEKHTALLSFLMHATKALAGKLKGEGDWQFCSGEV